MKYLRPIMLNAGSGCASDLADLLNKRGAAWCRQNTRYILEELQARCRARGQAWDRAAAAEILEVSILAEEIAR